MQLRGLEAQGICGFWLWPSGLVKLVGFGLCWSESLAGFLVFGWACEGFLGLFLPRPCGLRVGFHLFSFWGDCLAFVPFVSSFLSFWDHGWAPLHFGGSGVLSQGVGSLCVFLVCLGIPW